MQSRQAQTAEARIFEPTTSVVIVGGGISGLVTAWHLISQRPELSVTVFEASDRVGGKLRQEQIAGHWVDVGAESSLWRRSEVIELLEELDIESVHPARYPALLWSRGRLETLPSGTLMGIPSDPKRAAGLLNEAEVERALDERALSGLSAGDDISVGDAVETALGSAVVDRMVEPLLGGVYAGHARELSTKAAVPALYRAIANGHLLTDAAAAASSAVSSDDPREVFGAPLGGMGGLPELVRQRLNGAGVKVVTHSKVTAIKRSPAFKGTWMLEVERDGLTEPVEAQAVVVAAPAPRAAALLPVLPRTEKARALLEEVEYASMAIVTYAFPAELAHRLPDGTGFLVPAIDGRTIKASTFSSIKWPWLVQEAPEVTYIRVSMGRHREKAVLERTDEQLIADGLEDLAQATGQALPVPLDAHVQRWVEGLPQYAVGHMERMRAVNDALDGLLGFEIVGAYRDGVGIPACIATARRAADSLINDLERGRGPLAAAALETNTATTSSKGEAQ